MPAFYDLSGGLVPPGRICKTWATDFDDAPTLPDWLTAGTTGADTGSSIEASTTGPGGIALTPAASINATSTIFGPEIDLSDADAPIALRINVVAYLPDSTNDSVEIGFQGTSAGGWGYWRVPTSDGKWRMVARDSGGVTNHTTMVCWENADEKRYTFSLLLTTQDKALYILEGDQVFHGHVFGSDMDLGVVQPVVRILTGVAETRILDVHQLSVERWWM